MSKILIVFIILAVVLISGCVKQSEEKVIEKTALISYTEFFCYWTEQSTPYAFFQFAYQENGEIKYVKTLTTCKDLIQVNATRNSIAFGEQIKLYFIGEKPIKIVRENGEVYNIVESEPSRNFFESKIITQTDTTYFNNSNSNKVIDQCILLNDNNQHDKCLSYQAAFLQDETICNKMIVTSNKELCIQWIKNVKDGTTS